MPGNFLEAAFQKNLQRASTAPSFKFDHSHKDGFKYNLLTEPATTICFARATLTPGVLVVIVCALHL
jgi:hypothetical protein